MKAIIIDTETTGLPNEPLARVIEVGLVALSIDLAAGAARVEDTFDSLVKPAVYDDEAAAGARAVHGIDRDQLWVAPMTEQVQAAMDAWRGSLGSAWASVHWFAWNCSFDQRMLWQSGFSTPPLAEIKHTLKASGYRVSNLDAALSDHQIPVPANRHRALPDALAEAHLFATAYLRAALGGAQGEDRRG